MASMKALAVVVCLLLVSPTLATNSSGDESGSGSGDACNCLPCEVCVNGVCEVAPQGHVCAESQGPCEVNATCDGSTRICARAFRPFGHVCRASIGGCDRADICSGDNETCPDAVRLAGEICRNSSAPCEEHALCDGSTTTCPANPLSSIGKSCGLSQGPCEANATCSGLSVLCPRVFLAASTVCRPASGSCDENDLCTGNSSECTETVKPSTFECRSSTGPCEQPANCDGSTKDCPANLFVPSGVVCDSRCDVNYTCSGSSVSCPSSPAPCSSHGSCSVNTCVCSTGFIGSTCASCAAGRFGPSCAVCPGNGNCSGQGTCDEGITGTGVCTCAAGFFGVGCGGRLSFQLNASQPQDGQSTVTVRVENSLGGFPAINTSVFLHVDDSNLYRPNSTSGSRLVTVVNGVGSYVLTSSIYGRVTVSTVDTVANNIIGSSINITFPNIASPEDDPAPGSAFITGNVAISGFPCQFLSNSVLGEVVASLAAAMSVPISRVSVLAVACGGVSSPLNRRSASTGLDVGTRVVVDNEANVGPAAALFTTVTSPPVGGGSPALLNNLLSQPNFQNIVTSSGAVLTVSPVVPQVAVSGVNCSADSWTPWSSCLFQRCGGGQGVQSRSRRCPAESQTRLCNAPPCGNCSVNNGGCAANATCRLAADSTAVCTCDAAFLGDGLTCFSRNSTSSLSLVVSLFYPAQLSTIAPLAIDVLRLQATLVNKALVILGTPSSRIAFSQIVTDTSGFFFIASIAPPALPSDPTAVDLQSAFSAGVSGGGMDLPTVGASLSSSSTGSSLFPSTGASTTNNSSWENRDYLYIAIALAAFFAFLSLMLALHILRLRRRSANITATKGPSWLAAPSVRGRALSFVDSSDDTKKIVTGKARNSVGPAAPNTTAAAPNAPGVVRSRPSQWEIEAIENELPSVPAVRHYYPGWEASSPSASKSPIASSPWI